MSGNKNKLLRRIISFVLCITLLVGIVNYDGLQDVFKKKIVATDDTISSSTEEQLLEELEKEYGISTNDAEMEFSDLYNIDEMTEADIQALADELGLSYEFIEEALTQEEIGEEKTENIITGFTSSEIVLKVENIEDVWSSVATDIMGYFNNDESTAFSISIENFVASDAVGLQDDGKYLIVYDTILHSDYTLADGISVPKLKLYVNTNYEELSTETLSKYSVIRQIDFISEDEFQQISDLRTNSATMLAAATANYEFGFKNVNTSYESIVVDDKNDINTTTYDDGKLHNVLTQKMGKYRFNVTGASNICEKNDDESYRSYCHVGTRTGTSSNYSYKYDLSTFEGSTRTQKITSPAHNDGHMGVGFTGNVYYYGNSSAAPLKHYSNGTDGQADSDNDEIKWAYLVIEYSDTPAGTLITDEGYTEGSGDTKQDFSAYYAWDYKIKFGAYDSEDERVEYITTYMKNFCHDKSGRCMSFINVSEFVKDYGYTDYFVANIPYADIGLYNATGIPSLDNPDYAFFDQFACWKLIVVEKDPDLETVRFLNLKLGANEIDGYGGWDYATTPDDSKSTNETSFTGFSTSTGIDNNKVSGQFIYSMNGADGGDGYNVIGYRYKKSNGTWSSDDFHDLYLNDASTDEDDSGRTVDKPFKDIISKHGKIVYASDWYSTRSTYDASKVFTKSDYKKSGGDLDITSIGSYIDIPKGATSVQTMFRVGWDADADKNGDGIVDVTDGHTGAPASLGLLYTAQGIAIDIALEYENTITSVVWEDGVYTVKGKSKCVYSPTNGYYGTKTLINVPTGFKATSCTVKTSTNSVNSVIDPYVDDMAYSTTIGDKTITIKWGRKTLKTDKETTFKTYASFKNDYITWTAKFVLEDSSDTKEFNTKKTTFKSYIGADGIVTGNSSTGVLTSVSLTDKEEDSVEDSNIASGYGIIESLVVDPNGGTVEIQDLEESEEQDKTVYAEYSSSQQYTFGVNKKGYDEDSDSYIQSNITTTLKIKTPKRTGYIFDGWEITVKNGNDNTKKTQWSDSDSNGSGTFTFSKTVNDSADYKLKAKWKRPITTLYADLNVYSSVGSNGTQTQLKNNWVVTHNTVDTTAGTHNDTYTINALANSNELVKVCDGGYLDTDTIPDPVPTKYTLSLNYGGGKDGSNKTSSTQTTNRAFDGWEYSEDTDNTGDWTHSTTTKSATFTHGLGDGKTATITATWTGNYNLTLPKVSRYGYVFLGWYYTDSDGNEQLYSTNNTGISITMDSDKSFYAKWRRSATYLKVDLNVYETVGDNGTQTQLKNNWVVTHNQTIIDDTKHDAVSGNTTYTTTALTNHYEFVQVCKGAYTDTDTIPDPVPTQYTLTLDYANGWNVNGSQYEIDVDSLTRDTYSTISGSTYSAPNRSYKSKTDRTFNGWTYTEDTANTGDWTHSTTSKSGTFTHGADDEKTAYLTANWKGSYCLYLPKVERYGYTFLGWYDSNGVQYTDDNSGMYKIVMDENLNLTARWKLDTINIPVSVSWLDSNNEYTSRPPAIYFELYRSNAKSSSDNSTFTKSNAYILVTTTTANGTWGYNNFTKDDYDTDETNMPHNTIPVSGQPITGDNTNPTTINKWEYTILQLQKTNVETGVDYVYKLKEIECKSLDLTTEYGVSYDSGSDKYDYAKEKYYQISNQTQWGTQTATDTYSWTNRLLNQFLPGNRKNVTGTVTFEDNNDKYHFRPYTMVIELYQNNPISRDDNSTGIRKLYDSVTLKSLYPYSSTNENTHNVWSYSFLQLPTIDEENCTKYSYDVILTHDDERYRYTDSDWNDMYENKHINSTTYLQYDFVNNQKIVGDIYQSKANGVASTKKDFLSIYGNSAYNLRYYYISEAYDLSVQKRQYTYDTTTIYRYTESLVWNFTATINSNSFVSPPVNYSGSNSPDDRTGVFNGTGIGNTDDDYTHTNNIVTFTNTVYNQGEETAQNSDFNKINTKKKNEYFLLRLEQIQKSWSGSGDLITETYADGLWSGNSYNVIIPANGSTTLEYLPDGKYEVYIYGNNNNDTDVKDADFDFWKMTQVSGSNITFSKELQSDGSYKYYIETSSEAETATATLKHWNKIHTWRGYVDDDIKNSTNLRTSDFATDVDFRNP